VEQARTRDVGCGLVWPVTYHPGGEIVSAARHRQPVLAGVGRSSRGRVVTIHIRLLGQFVIEIDGHTVASVQLRRRAPGGLVKLLALQPMRRLHRDQVIDALWPDLLVSEALSRCGRASTCASTPTSSSTP
jgi:hypothetical protein